MEDACCALFPRTRAKRLYRVRRSYTPPRPTGRYLSRWADLGIVNTCVAPSKPLFSGLEVRVTSQARAGSQRAKHKGDISLSRPQRQPELYKRIAASMAAGGDTASVSRAYKCGLTAALRWDRAVPSAMMRDRLKIASCQLWSGHFAIQRHTRAPILELLYGPERKHLCMGICSRP